MYTHTHTHIYIYILRPDLKAKQKLTLKLKLKLTGGTKATYICKSANVAVAEATDRAVELSCIVLNQYDALATPCWGCTWATWTSGYLSYTLRRIQFTNNDPIECLVIHICRPCPSFVIVIHMVQCNGA